jgi:mannosyltransferase
LLALAPRLSDLSSKPFWHDEITTAMRAAMPLPALIRNAFISHHTPLYFLLVAPLAHMPDPQFWLRLPSAILGALNVMLVFGIAARAGGLTAGIAAALVMGLGPTEIAYSQEARSYMLMIFFLLVALSALIQLAESGERAALPWRASGLGWVWMRFIAGSAAAFCTLGDSLPWLLTASVTASVLSTNVRNRSGLLRNFFAANAISLGVSLPLYLATILESGKLHNNINFVLETTASLIWYDIESVYIYGDACDTRQGISLTEFQTLLAPLGTPSAELHAGSRIIMWRYDPVRK